MTCEKEVRQIAILPAAPMLICPTQGCNVNGKRLCGHSNLARRPRLKRTTADFTPVYQRISYNVLPVAVHPVDVSVATPNVTWLFWFTTGSRKVKATNSIISNKNW
jgi:hypothetical protein